MSNSRQKGVPVTLVLVILILGLGVVLAETQGYIDLPFLNLQPPQTDDPITDPTDPAYLGSAKLQFDLAGYITGTSITSGNNKMDIFLADSNGVFDLTKRYGGAITINSAPEQGTQMIPQGAQVIMHVSSDNDPTGGTDHYDMWFVIPNVDVNARVYEMTMASLRRVGGGYELTGSYGSPLAQTIGRSGEYGSTTYWEIGTLTVKERASATNLDTKVIYNGETLTSVSDGSSWDDTLAEQNADGTLISNTGEEVDINLLGGANDVGYGSSMLVLTDAGVLEEYVAVVIVTTNCTTIDESEIYQASEGWVALSDNTLYAEKGWICRVPEVMPSKGDNFDLTISLPFEPTATSTAYSFNAWIIDFVKFDQAQVGSVSTSIPSAKGGLTEFGIDAKILATAFSTSSGKGSGMVHFADITSAS